MDKENFDIALESCESVIKSYEDLEIKNGGGNGGFENEEYIDPYRFKPVI
jgi:hypothetical protein